MYANPTMWPLAKVRFQTMERCSMCPTLSHIQNQSGGVNNGMQ